MSEIESFEFDLEPDDEWPPVSSECLPVRSSPDGYVVLTPPLFIMGISVGDVLRITVEEEVPSRVGSWSHVARSGNSTIWLAKLRDAAGELSRLSQRLRAVGCEVTDAPALGMCTVNVPSTVPIASVDEILEGVSPDVVAVVFPSMRHDVILPHMDVHFGAVLAVEREEEGLEVVRRHGPHGLEVVTWTTRGMSRHAFAQPNGGRARFELVVASHARFACRELPDSILAIGAALIGLGAGPRQQEILALPFEIPGSAMRCALVYPPTMWDDDAGEVVGTDVPTFIAWIIPLAEPERVLVATRGVAALESHWEREQVDVLDLGR